MFKKNKNYCTELVINNFNCWYITIENLYKEIDENHIPSDILTTYNSSNNGNKNNITIKQILNQLVKYKTINNNLPYFELYFIKMLQLNSNKTIMDLVCLGENEYYPNCHNFYTYEHIPSKKEVNKIITMDLYKQYIYTIRNYFSYSGAQKLDFIMVTDYRNNNQLTTYFSLLKELLINKNSKYKLDNYSYINKNNNNINEIINLVANNINTYFKLFACVLRNTNDNEKQKTIIGIIKDNKQYILHNTLKIEFNWVNDTQLINNDYSTIDETGFIYKYNFAIGNKLLLYYNNTNEKIKSLTLKTNNNSIIQIQPIKQCWVDDNYNLNSNKIISNYNDTIVSVISNDLYIEPCSTTIKPFLSLMRTKKIFL